MKKSRIASLAAVASIGVALTTAGPATADPIRFSTWVLGQYDGSLTSSDLNSVSSYVSMKCEWAAGANIPPRDITARGVQTGLRNAKGIRINQDGASYIAGFLQACARQ